MLVDRRGHGRASSRWSRCSRYAQPGRVIVAAKHTAQRAAATMAGADEVVRPEHALKAVRRAGHAVKLTPERGQEFLLGGADVAIECTGSKRALDLALRTTKAGGRVVVSGIPGAGRRPHARCGSASSSSSAPTPPAWKRRRRAAGTFDLALELASQIGPMLAAMVGATYPLARWREAIDHAMSAGRLGTFKVAFAPQESSTPACRAHMPTTTSTATT